MKKIYFFLFEIFKENSDFQNFLKNPTYQLEVQIKVFKEILKVIKLNKILENFLQLIIKKEEFIF